MTSVHFVGGLIWSPADQATPVAQELLVTDGRITATGSSLIVPAAAERVDLAGGTLIPAFGDGHVHPLQAGLESLFAPVRGDSIAAVLDGVRTWAHAHPDREWVYGGGFDLALTPDGIFDAAWLDQVLPDRPVVLRGADYHTLWCNSLALQRSGITADTPERPDGEILRRPDGTPIGTLREWGATQHVFETMPAPSRVQQVEAIDDATALCAAAGLTWLQDAWVEPSDVVTYLEAAASGALRIAVNLAFRADPKAWTTQLDEFIALRRTVELSSFSQLTARTVKFFVDGVIESGTAAMLEPYLDCPHSHGMSNWPCADLADAVRRFSRAGFQVHLHAIGDAAVRDALDAIEASGDVIGEADLRPVIAHLQVIDPADLERLAGLGVFACFQPLWAQPDPMQEVLTIPRIGPERAALQYPIRTVLESGATVSFGSDWPVTEVAPLAGLVTAVTRQTPTGQPVDGWFPAERIGLRSAFAAYTRGVALQGFRDDAGTLDVGAVADLTWLAPDLRTAGPSDLRVARVLGTWMAGRRVY